MLEGPGFGADAGGASEYVDSSRKEDGRFEIDLDASHGHVEIMGILEACYLGVVCYASRFYIGQVNSVVYVIEHIDIAEADGRCEAEVPAR